MAKQRKAREGLRAVEAAIKGAVAVIREVVIRNGHWVLGGYAPRNEEAKEAAERTEDGYQFPEDMR